MTSVKLLMSALVGFRNYLPGNVVSVPDGRARSMIAEGVAEASGPDGSPAGHSNADANPLADTLTPLPHGAIPINPVDALSPHVGDNPGLNKLVDVVGRKDQVSPSGRTSTIQPVPTLEVATQEQIDQSHAEANPAKAASPAKGDGDLTTASVVKAKPARAETATLSGAPANASTLSGKAD